MLLRQCKKIKLKSLCCIALLAGAAALLSACAQIPSLSAKAKQVEATTTWPAKSCQLLGPVKFVMANENLLAGKLEQGAMNGAKNKTAALGGNYLHIKQNYTTFLRPGLGANAAAKVTISGFAYRCKA